MPRSSNGNYALPAGNPVVDGTIIETNWANPTMSDLGTEIASSLDRQGRGGMLAPLKIVDGNAGAPGLAMNQEANTGLFRGGPQDLSVAVAGRNVANFKITHVQFNYPPRYNSFPVNSSDLVNKAYLDTALGSAGLLPSFSGNVGNFLTVSQAEDAAVWAPSVGAALNLYSIQNGGL